MALVPGSCSPRLVCVATFLCAFALVPSWAVPAASETGSGPDALAVEDVEVRRLCYMAIMAVLAVLVLLLGVGAVWLRSEELRLGPVHCGCFRWGPVAVVQDRGEAVFQGPCFSRGDCQVCQLCRQRVAQACSICKALGRAMVSPQHLQELLAGTGTGTGTGSSASAVATVTAVTVTGDGSDVMRTVAEQRRQHGWFLRFRHVLLSILLVVYAAASALLPAINSSAATCNRGFFWEDHLAFMCVFFLSKVVETCLYAMDPTMHGELALQDFMLKFLTSCLGFIDGYTDAVAIAIAFSCPGDLAHGIAVGMAWSYVVGVLLAQWLFLALLSCADPSHACLMKLLHMDALAACVTLPSDRIKKIWVSVNVVRFLLEDLPQAVLQVLFLVHVKHNYFMLVSVAISAASSCKAISDAVRRSAFAAGIQRFMDEVHRHQQEAQTQARNQELDRQHRERAFRSELEELESRERERQQAMERRLEAQRREDRIRAAQQRRHQLLMQREELDFHSDHLDPREKSRLYDKIDDELDGRSYCSWSD